MSTNPYAGQPFTSSDGEIAAALEQVSIPTLLLSLVHVTGDPRFIREFSQAGVFLNEVQGFMSEEDKAKARAVALPVIADYRDRGCPGPVPLSPELIDGLNELLLPTVDQLRAVGAFPAAMTPPSGADAETRLLCAVGFWHP